MTRFFQLSLNDFRNVLREQILWMLYFAAPLVQFLAARMLLPWLEGQFPTLAAYRPLIVILMTIQITSGIGFVLASIMLDEKDDGVLTAIRVLPLSADAFLFSRLGTGLLVAFLFSLVMLAGTGAFHLPALSAAGGSFLLALIMPVVVLALAGLARNKVEGLALFKVLSTLLLLPALSLFLPHGLGYLLAVIPVYWSMHFIMQGANGQPAGLFFAAALLTHLLVLRLLYRWFRRRVFEKS